MTRYLISFPSGAMDHIPQEELPAVGEAAHAVAREAMDAGVWVFGGGLAENVDPVLVAGDGTTTDGTYPQTKELDGGFTVLDVSSRQAALEWAAKIAAACRLCSRDSRVHARPSGGRLIEAPNRLARRPGTRLSAGPVLRNDSRTDARLAADTAGAERSCVGADLFECVGERFDVGVGEVLGKVSLDSVSVVAAGAL